MKLNDKMIGITDKDFDLLSKREKEVVSHLKKGLSRKEIADVMGITLSAVSNYIWTAAKRIDGKPTYNKEWVEEYRKDNEHYREYVKEYSKSYHKEHRDDRIKNMRDYNKKYYENHREEILEKTKKREML